MSTPRAAQGGLTVALLASVLPMFAVTMNNLVVTSALPSIGRDLGGDVDVLQWVFNAYVLVFAAGLPAAAAIGERLGNRRVFAVSIAWFGVASLLCALARNNTELIAGRVLQGVGAAAILPLSLTLLVHRVGERRRELAVGLWSGMAGLSLATGAVIGGAVTSGWNWRWIFWMYVLIAVVALPMALWVFARSPRGHRPPDVVGMVMLAVPLALIVWGTSESTQHGWLSPHTLVWFGLAVLGFAAFAWWQRRAPQPLLPLAFYRNRTMMLSNLGCLTLYFGVFGSVFFLMQYLQGPLGYTPVEAGVHTLPWTLMPLFVSPLTGLVISRIGGGRVLAAAAALQAVGLGWIALIATPHLAYGLVVPPMVLAGIGMGMEFAATNELVLSSVPKEQHNMAVSARNTAAEIGGVLGVAVLTTVFQRNQPGPGADPGVGFVDGLVPAIWVGVAVVAVGALAGALIRREREASSNPLPANVSTTAQPSTV